MKKTAINLGLAALFSAATISTYSFASGNPIKKETTKSVKAKESFNNIEFGFDKATISRYFEAELDELVAVAKENGYAIKLSGHADAIGEYVYNWKLSKSRADHVKNYLVNKGVSASKIAATEFGDTKPIASNATAEGRKKNRRVEIEIVD
ncbi:MULTISPECIES: OmpA family protein [Olivibacter]|uniref:OmpA family protein n=1 Tax=Olivibacter jilunii TaxID=985016 RepID=A0ABW6BAG3_9SPHI|nr:OmpA family protein [Olivibacter sp. UJ_SKK_5.1]